MNEKEIISPTLFFFENRLMGESVQVTNRKLSDLTGLFKDEESFNRISADTLVYEIYSYAPVKEGIQGGLYLGLTRIYSGKVGQEYFMTKGHFHQQLDRAEYYWGLEGEGMLILMDQQRRIRAEKMYPGSIHYIPGGVAHRVANTTDHLLSFAACWPSDAGHNYITPNGFSVRLLDMNGIPQLI